MSQQQQDYIPLHERPLPPRNATMPASPHYAPNSDDEANQTQGHKHADQQAESSASGGTRKRQRGSEDDADSSRSSSVHQAYLPRPAFLGIAPSIFGVAPRNEFTAVVGQWLMETCRGQEHVEIEIKLGHLNTRNHVPEPAPMAALSWTERIVPPELMPGHQFVSDMAPNQHAAFNALLNEHVRATQKSPLPLLYEHTYHTDSTYEARSGKTRVTTDQDGNFVEAVNKTRLGDLNIRSPQQIFDWRISVSTERPSHLTKAPDGNPSMRRFKDRMSYKHQLCQIDLTKVTVLGASPPKISYEIEVEVIDVPTLLREGNKDAKGQPNTFDDALQSILDSVRMLAKNAVRRV